MTLGQRLVLLPFLAAAPAISVALYLLWTQPHGAVFRWTATLLILGVWLCCVRILWRRNEYMLRTASNLLSALREGDYSFRARKTGSRDAFGELMAEINALGESLQEQRLGSVERAVLLGKVLEEVDVAVLAFDDEDRLRLINRRAQALLGLSLADAEGQTAQELDLTDWLGGEVPRIEEVKIGARRGRWELRRGHYLEGGRRHRLLFLSDLTPALREEERQAWQRLLQVLRHEVNNSLAPIQSLASSLNAFVESENPPHQWREELREGLDVISNRSKSLSRFMNSYTRLTSLPKPQLERMDVGQWVRRVVGLESRMEIAIRGGPPLSIMADSALMEQLLINLLRNAVEAAMETSGTVEIAWHSLNESPKMWELCIDDTGPGFANTDHLFVPFYTTKPEGSGIGLVLSRQIAEVHGGTLTLQNRIDTTGCRAILRLPLK